MIKKINIKKFGLFADFLWDNTIGRDFAFKKLNIIYGRNYSGKTTLSRIFRCIELGQLHDDYSDCNFSLKLDDGSDVTNSNVHTFQNKVRVYNSDFVKENLSWLHNNDGTIHPFTILGAKNVEIDKRINEIDEAIGNEIDKTGLAFNLLEKKTAYAAKRKTIDNKNTELGNKLTDKARVIKNNSKIYNVPTYQINSLKTDISALTANSVLDEIAIESFNKLLKEEAKSSITKLSETKPGFNIFFTKVKDLVEKEIRPSKPITDLINDSLLQEWVRQGIDQHKTKRTTCGFCGSPLPVDIWKKLDEHFSKESQELRNQLAALNQTLSNSKQTLTNFLSLKKDGFYSSTQAEFDQLASDWNAQITLYNANLDSLIKNLEEREKDIFKSKVLPTIADNSQAIFDLIINFNTLIEKNNQLTDSLGTDQGEARRKLRLSEVAKFTSDIDFDKKLQEINDLEEEIKPIAPEIKECEKQINDLLEEKRILEAQAKDESRGAELVNQHLSHFFGHDELKLEAEGESPNMKFKITRFNIDAKNLSEGECSLISFCYFIAKIEDELKEPENTNKLILYIDDPISSLDSNHIFFMFSLIESVIAKPKNYDQLFISTHNLDFLKYLKKLTIPKEKAQPDSKNKPSINHLMIERKSRNNSVLRLSPDYLKNYITEFNYLFGQILHCAEADLSQVDHSYNYNFGNNTRKFLEAYLFYKYPSHRLSLDERLDLFFENDAVAINLINRVINEYSHLGEQFDRGLEPIDVDVIQKIALSIMNKMKACDIKQYDALVESLTA